MSTPSNPAPFNQPPRPTDRFLLTQYTDGTSTLTKCKNPNKCKPNCSDSDVVSQGKISYADLNSSVTQRVYDYAYFVSQFFISNRETDPVGWQAALDRLMTVFSKNLYSFANITNGEAMNIADTWAGVRDIYITLYTEFFRGYTLHTAPDVRVIPLCDSTDAQAYTSSGEFEHSRLNRVDVSPNPIISVNVAYYTFKWRYESDGVFRIVSWQVDNRLQYVIPQDEIILEATPYQAYEQDPPDNCGTGKC
jgi:hypothetical protein